MRPDELVVYMARLQDSGDSSVISFDGLGGVYEQVVSKMGDEAFQLSK